MLYAEAISMYTKAMNQDPANTLAPYGRGVAERKHGDPQAAVDAFGSPSLWTPRAKEASSGVSSAEFPCSLADLHLLEEVELAAQPALRLRAGMWFDVLRLPGGRNVALGCQLRVVYLPCLGLPVSAPP